MDELLQKIKTANSYLTPSITNTKISEIKDLIEEINIFLVENHTNLNNEFVEILNDQKFSLILNLKSVLSERVAIESSIFKDSFDQHGIYEDTNKYDVNKDTNSYNNLNNKDNVNNKESDNSLKDKDPIKDNNLKNKESVSRNKKLKKLLNQIEELKEIINEIDNLIYNQSDFVNQIEIDCKLTKNKTKRTNNKLENIIKKKRRWNWIKRFFIVIVVVIILCVIGYLYNTFISPFISK